jgi:branched-chain amino acid transport system substrate-binding protein
VVLDNHNKGEDEMKNKQVTIVLVALSFLLVAGFSTQAMAGETYKMGLSIAITGPTSDVGSPYSKGVEDYVKYVNDENSWVMTSWSASSAMTVTRPKLPRRNFEEFLDEDIVFYLNYSTGSTMALRQDFQEEKIPVLPASFHAGNLEGNDYVFLPIASYSSQAVGLAEYVAANHKGSDKPKVALFLHPSAFGRAPRDDVKNQSKQAWPSIWWKSWNTARTWTTPPCSAASRAKAYST